MYSFFTLYNYNIPLNIRLLVHYLYMYMRLFILYICHIILSHSMNILCFFAYYR